jgi:predicted transcriptional regulator of viral defense system
MKVSLVEKRLKTAGIGAFFRPKDVKPLGVTYRQLQSLVAEGQVEPLGHGLYRVSEVETTELETVAMVSAAIPSAIVCLLTALAIHDIGTQLPHEVWIAINRKSRKPMVAPARIRVVRFSGAMLTCGVVQQKILGVSVRVTSPARTVVDCFRYRNKIGIDVALEALKDAVTSSKTSVDEIDRTAEVCRVRTVIRPYLEALSA